jgi:2-methylisocitrate lyase-like PEP mutase family enzyme
VTSVQAQKAEAFRALHHGGRLLVLPNVWDPLGARMLEELGYPAVATASASIAFSLGYEDGERITFDAMLAAVRRVAGAVDVPVTADIERGFADSPDDVAANVRRVLEAGAVGINLEDSRPDGTLYEIDAQCERIAAVRTMADGEGVPLFVNARCDAYSTNAMGSHDANLTETITRERAYVEAGADGIYPITIGDAESLTEIGRAVTAPINVFASATAAPMRELERIGVQRLSLGPGLMRASFATMKAVAKGLLAYESYDRFTTDVPAGRDIEGVLRPGPMPAE